MPAGRTNRVGSTLGNGLLSSFLLFLFFFFLLFLFPLLLSNLGSSLLLFVLELLLAFFLVLLFVGLQQKESEQTDRQTDREIERNVRKTKGRRVLAFYTSACFRHHTIQGRWDRIQMTGEESGHHSDTYFLKNLKNSSFTLQRRLVRTTPPSS